MWYLLKSAIEDLQRNKGRTLLTSLGILVGVFAVVILMAMGVGLRTFIEEQFDNLGTNLVIVLPGNIISDSGGFQDNEGGVGTVKFDQRDVHSLERLVNVKYVVPTFMKTLTIKAVGETKVSNLFASTPDMFVIRKLEPEYGELFTKADLRKKSRVAVLGPKIAEELFGNSSSALGKTIRLENQHYVVKGVLKSKGGGGLGGPDFDSFTYLPYTSVTAFNPDNDFQGIYIQAIDKDLIPKLKESITRQLLKRYKADDFSVIEQTQILDTVSGIFGMVNIVLVAIASISLIVGGIGIMNIMYASVMERFKEIGIRRALGATRSNIMSQFVTEAGMLSAFGGFFGLVFASIGVVIARWWFPAEINIEAVLLAMGVSTGIGIFFGVFPARKAANLPPIEAIRKR